MAKFIKAASVVVTLQPTSPKFIEAMERAKCGAINGTNAIIKVMNSRLAQ